MMINARRHVLLISIIFLLAMAFNSLPWVLSGIPLSRQLSSDPEFHVIHLYEYSKNYDGSFANDTSFHYDIRPAGDTFINKVFVSFGDFLNISMPDLSVAVSIASLLIFLSGVYILSFFVLNNYFLAFIISLGSIIPTFALGGATWGFLTLGYMPRELALGIILWILFLFLYGKKNNMAKSAFMVFLALGLFANWYPVIFLHFALVLLLTDIIQKRKISKEHFLYGILFVSGASFAVFDIISKSGMTILPDLNILHIRFGYMTISSFEYGVFHYLRRVILYFVWIISLLFIYKKFLKEKITPHTYKVGGEIKEGISFWASMFFSSAIVMTIGLLLEAYTIYAKFIFSRASLFFILSSMLISAMVLSNVFDYLFSRGRFKKIIVGGLLLLIFIGQSSIPTMYRSLKGVAQNADEQKSFLNAMDFLFEHTTPKDIVLADANYANKIRAYGKRAVYTSWKDGGISLLDGRGGREWYDRFIQNNEILQTGDLDKILKFSEENGISVIYIETGKIDKKTYQEKKLKYYQVGNYDIVLLK